MARSPETNSARGNGRRWESRRHILIRRGRSATRMSTSRSSLYYPPLYYSLEDSTVSVTNQTLYELVKQSKQSMQINVEHVEHSFLGTTATFREQLEAKCSATESQMKHHAYSPLFKDPCTRRVELVVPDNRRQTRHSRERVRLVDA